MKRQLEVVLEEGEVDCVCPLRNKVKSHDQRKTPLPALRLSWMPIKESHQSHADIRVSTHKEQHDCKGDRTFVEAQHHSPSCAASAKSPAEQLLKILHQQPTRLPD